MVVRLVVSSLNRKGDVTPGFIPVYLNGMPDSSMPAEPHPFLFLRRLRL